jgi:hypothetical protein
MAPPAPSSTKFFALKFFSPSKFFLSKKNTSTSESTKRHQPFPQYIPEKLIRSAPRKHSGVNVPDTCSISDTLHQTMPANVNLDVEAGRLVLLKRYRETEWFINVFMSSNCAVSTHNE